MIHKIGSDCKKSFAALSPHGGGHSTAGDFDSEADSTISSRRQGSRSRRHGSRDQGDFNTISVQFLFSMP